MESFTPNSTIMIKKSNFIKVTALAALFISLVSCGGKQSFPVAKYYEYDQELPLLDSVHPAGDTADNTIFYLTYRSVHNAEVTGLLSLPREGTGPFPVVILMHGLGDRKTVDYVEAGNEYLIDAGYAVLRLDIKTRS